MRHYRIIRETEKSLSVYNDMTRVREKVWYVAKQRFLWVFWLAIGHQTNDYPLFEVAIEHKAKTKQAMEEYLRAWHEVYYGKEKYKVEYNE